MWEEEPPPLQASRALNDSRRARLKGKRLELTQKAFKSASKNLLHIFMEKYIILMAH